MATFDVGSYQHKQAQQKTAVVAAGSIVITPATGERVQVRILAGTGAGPFIVTYASTGEVWRGGKDYCSVVVPWTEEQITITGGATTAVYDSITLPAKASSTTYLEDV